MFQEKIKLFHKKISENPNKEYRIFLTVFFALMTFFVTSKLWLPSDVKIINSEIGSQKSTSTSTSLVLDSWQYNEKNHYMEVSLSVKNADDMQDIQFVPTAHTNQNKSVALNTNVAYSSNDLLMVQIKNVPQKWEVISLWIKEQNNSTDTASSEPSDTLKGANFFCDIRKVKINNSLEPQSKLNYAMQSIYNQITEVKKQITEINNQIDSANVEIKQLDFDISALKANQKYQTQDEIQKSNSSIKNKTSQIDNLKNDILNYQTQIEKNKNKLQKLNQKLNDTKTGKIPAVLNSSPNAVISSAPSTSTEPNQNVIVD